MGTLCKCKKVNDESAKRSNPRSGVCSMQYAVGASAKRSTHTVDLANMGVGTLPLVQKGQTHAVGYVACSRYAVHSRC